MSECVCVRVCVIACECVRVGAYVCVRVRVCAWVYLCMREFTGRPIPNQMAVKISVHVVFGVQGKMHFLILGFFILTHQATTPQQQLQHIESMKLQKKREYAQRIREVEHGVFTQLWLRCRLSFANQRSAILCIRGSRSSRHRTTRDIALATSEGHVPPAHL